MGVNICIYNQQGQEHPTWESGRMAGDRDFAAGYGRMPHTTWQRGHPMDDDWLVRPTEFKPWRDWLNHAYWAQHNPGRWDGLLDILEGDDQWWLYFSY